jgi:hypothetical protein
MERKNFGDILDRLMPKPPVRQEAVGRRGSERENIFFARCSEVADYARYIAYRGSYSNDGVRITYTAGSEYNLYERPYEYKGTWFVPLDFNRYISVRELKSEGPYGEVKVGLRLMVGDSEPQTIATFSDEDLIELNSTDTVNLNDLAKIEELLIYINNSEEK